ncbi:MAG: hypothetical protein AAFZ15_12515 [Bacteroidota bacterium]
MDILCINDNFSSEQIAEIPHRPIQGKMYTIRDIIKSGNGIGLLLNEIHNPKNGWIVKDGMKFTFEPNFNINRFSDLENRPLNYEMIKQVEKVRS